MYDAQKTLDQYFFRLVQIFGISLQALYFDAIGVPSWRPLTAVVAVRADGKAAMAITKKQHLSKALTSSDHPFLALIYKTRLTINKNGKKFYICY